MNFEDDGYEWLEATTLADAGKVRTFVRGRKLRSPLVVTPEERGAIAEAAARAYGDGERHSVALSAAVEAAFRAAGIELTYE